MISYRLRCWLFFLWRHSSTMLEALKNFQLVSKLSSRKRPPPDFSFLILSSSLLTPPFKFYSFPSKKNSAFSFIYIYILIPSKNTALSPFKSKLCSFLFISKFQTKPIPKSFNPSNISMVSFLYKIFPMEFGCLKIDWLRKQSQSIN